MHAGSKIILKGVGELVVASDSGSLSEEDHVQSEPSPDPNCFLVGTWAVVSTCFFFRTELI